MLHELPFHQLLTRQKQEPISKNHQPVRGGQEREREEEQAYRRQQAS
jgi:hypothetical protein